MYQASGNPVAALKRCSVCNAEVAAFLPWGRGSADLSPVITALECVGSDVDNFYCPNCRCHDRERHLFLFLATYANCSPRLLHKMRGAAILHFGPEQYLQILIEQQQPASYIKADLNPTSPAYARMSVEKIEHRDRAFDFVIANHVLEHVDDDLAALHEIHRVLKIGGYAILQTPYSALLPTSVKEIDETSVETRRILFGQEDHVRRYGNDIFRRFCRSGLTFVGGYHAALRLPFDPATFGVNAREPFFLFQK